MVTISPEPTDNRTDPRQPELFEVIQPPVPRVRRPAGSGKPRWTKYRVVNPIKCDDCMLALYLAKGEGPASRQAHWRRKQGDSDLLLCYAHASIRREEDGLAPLGDID